MNSIKYKIAAALTLLPIFLFSCPTHLGRKKLRVRKFFKYQLDSKYDKYIATLKKIEKDLKKNIKQLIVKYQNSK